MGSWIFEVPFIVILIWLAIQSAERTSNILKSAMGIAALYAVPKMVLPLLFGAGVGAMIAVGIIEFAFASVYFFLVLRFYGSSSLWWVITILGALVFLLTNL